MKPQILVTYYHDNQKLSFVSAINSDRIEVEGTVDKQYSRARSLMKGIEAGSVAEHGGGFYYAIINTNYSGWRVEINTDEIKDVAHFMSERQRLIDELNDMGWTNVGSDIARMKGEIGKGLKPQSWSRKFNVSNMTKFNIFSRIVQLELGREDKLDVKSKNEIYNAIVMPDRWGPKARNFGNYEVDSLSNIFLYIYHLHERVVTE